MQEQRELQRITAWARPYLVPGETLRAATWGVTSALGAVLGTAKGRIVAVSETSVYILESSMWRRMSKARALVARHPRGSVTVRVKGGHLVLGDEGMVVHFHHRARARKVVELASTAPVPGEGLPMGAPPAPPVEGQCLDVDALHRRYGERLALDGLTFAVTPGHLFGFLGPNGAGKTTCMRIMLGIDLPDAGEVRWSGRPVEEATRMRFGYMPEQRGLYPKMRVRDQLVYLATLHGVPDHEAASSTDYWLARLGIADRSDDRLDRLSHGNQQRAQLAAALVHNPLLLVLDEPFSGLDPVGVHAMVGVLQERVDAGATVVFSSHQLDLVEDICDEVAIIDSGKVVLAGKVAALKAAGPRRLTVNVVGAAEDWLGGLGVAGVSTDAHGRFRIDLGSVDPQLVLDRATGRVEHFGIDEPTLSELFLKAVA